MQKQSKSNRPLLTLILAVMVFVLLSCCCFLFGGPTVGVVLSGIRTGLEDSGQTDGGNPGPTLTPNIAPLYATIEAEYSTMTDVQQDDYFDSLAGAEVVEWEGEIKDVVKVVGLYSVMVDAGTSSFVADVYLLNIPEDTAKNLSLGDTITFSGKIQNVEEIVSPVVYVTNVTIHEPEGD